MTLIEFWRQHYPGENKEIPIVVKDGKPSMWLRRTPEWMYLCDANGAFRAARDGENLYQIVTDWLNSIKAGTDTLFHFCHRNIVQNVRFDPRQNRWIPAAGRDADREKGGFKATTL